MIFFQYCGLVICALILVDAAVKCIEYCSVTYGHECGLSVARSLIKAAKDLIIERNN